MAVLTINVDATTEPAAIAYVGQANFDDCPGGSGHISDDNQTVAHLFPVSAGAHTVNLLGRRRAGDSGVKFLGRSLTAIFIDHDSVGTSVAEEVFQGPDPTIKH